MGDKGDVMQVEMFDDSSEVVGQGVDVVACGGRDQGSSREDSAPLKNAAVGESAG